MSVYFQKWFKKESWRSEQRLIEANEQGLYEAWVNGFQVGIKHANIEAAKRKAKEQAK